MNESLSMGTLHGASVEPSPRLSSEKTRLIIDRYPEAYTAFEQSIHLNPNNSLTHDGKGSVLYTLRHYKHALAAFDHALQQNPRDQNAHRGKIHMLLRLKRYTELLPAMKQSLYWWMH